MPLLTGKPFESSSSYSMAPPLQYEGVQEDAGSIVFIRKDEFVRVITETLYSLGFRKSGAMLEEEYGITLHSSGVKQFIQQIHDGKWDESICTLREIGGLIDDGIVKLASLPILEQKFLEQSDGGKLIDALKTLRTEIAPLCVDHNKIREVSAYMVFPSSRSYIHKGLQIPSPTDLLEKLQKLIPGEVMVPERRLKYLVTQGLMLQRHVCAFHNSLEKEMSLYSDHQCGTSQIPCQTLQTLTGHNDEVWLVQFSHNGKHMASSSRNGLAIIWEVNVDGIVSAKHRLEGHQTKISCVSWSPNDRQLLTCGQEEEIRRWDVSSGECLHIYNIAGSPMFSCGWWSHSGEYIFAGTSDTKLYLFHLDGRQHHLIQVENCPGNSQFQVSNDGKLVFIVHSDKWILLGNIETKVTRYITADHKVASFSISNESKFLLANLFNGEIHLWSIENDPRLIAKYRGHRCHSDIIRSCFGGLGQAFIASGSEDQKVYIWHRGSEKLLKVLPGHYAAVNCVSWNPADPHMLASASCDGMIKIWGLQSKI